MTCVGQKILHDPCNSFAIPLRGNSLRLALIGFNFLRLRFWALACEGKGKGLRTERKQARVFRYDSLIAHLGCNAQQVIRVDAETALGTNATRGKRQDDYFTDASTPLVMTTVLG
jgi:hypothetical protein